MPNWITKERQSVATTINSNTLSHYHPDHYSLNSLGLSTVVEETISPHREEHAVQLYLQEEEVQVFVPLSDQQKQWQRIFIQIFTVAFNFAFGYCFFQVRSIWMVIFLAVMKIKVWLCIILQLLRFIFVAPYRYFFPKPEIESKNILSLIPIYAETEQQILKTISSLVTNQFQPHRQMLVLITDGKKRDMLGFFDGRTRSFNANYRTWKNTVEQMTVTYGKIQGLPAIALEKHNNQGKKDSLVIGHELFNYPPMGMAVENILLRSLMMDVLYKLKFGMPDYIFCTDADSIIDIGSLRYLTETCESNPTCAAATGIVTVDYSEAQYGVWNMFQSLQYLYGQLLRRQTESFIGRVTCLPGCITLFRCCEETANGITAYSTLPNSRCVIQHQVQFLGTDRRLTFSLLSQGSYVTTLMDTRASCQTIPPQSLNHFLSQRRRWGSNALFNSILFTIGPHIHPIVRFLCLIDSIRFLTTFVRLVITVVLISEMVSNYAFGHIIFFILITVIPLMYFFLEVVLDHRFRKEFHKLIVSYFVGHFMSFPLSVAIVVIVLNSVGSFSWGQTHGSTPTTVKRVPIRPKSIAGFTSNADTVDNRSTFTSFHDTSQFDHLREP